MNAQASATICSSPGLQGLHPSSERIRSLAATSIGGSPGRRSASRVEIFGTDYPTPDGTAVRDYIHIDDLAAAHLLVLERTRPGEHRIFNLGNGDGFSVREVIAAVQSATGREIPTREADRRAGDPPMLVAASELIRSMLGWKPNKPGLEQIVADAWAFAQARPDGYPD